MEETEGSIFADARLGKAVGPNAAHHLQQWRIMVSRAGGDPSAAERRFSFNAGAMLLGPAWLLHRKLYVPGLLVLAVVCAGLIASPLIGLALAALFAVLVGLGAEALLLKRTRRLLRDADAAGWSDAEIARRGGVSWLAPVIGVAVAAALVAVAIVTGAAGNGVSGALIGAERATNGAASQGDVTAPADLGRYDGVWVDQNGRWSKILFLGQQGVLSSVVPYHLTFVAHDERTGSDTIKVRDGMVGTVSESIFRVDSEDPGTLWITTDGSVGRFSLLRALTAEEAATLRQQIDADAPTLTDRLGEGESKEPSASGLVGKQTLELLTDTTRSAEFERQLTTEGFQEITCVMGADAPLAVEDGRFATSIAQAPPDRKSVV